MTNTPMQVDTPSQATEEEPKAESIQMNKLKMAFDIALSSSLSSASLNKVLAVLKPETEEEAAKIAAARLEAITFISQQATTEFSDICQARNLLEKLLSLDKAILDSRAEHNGVRGSNTETSGSKIELEREREILHGLKKQSAAMYTELLEKQNLLVSEMKAVQDLRDGIATAAENIEASKIVL